ncbi:MAG TPA: cytochrome c [Bryobacteraceae bacterium]|nr:cytochrome c [Bryobacteraceae bacterium]
MTARAGIIGCAALIGLIAASAQTKSNENATRLETTPAPLIDSMDGSTLYRAYCATCHGLDGKGVGPMTKWLAITSPDLTRISARSGGKFPLARVQKVISGQGETTPGHGTREMPVWGPIFSQVERDQDLRLMRVYSLAKYLETIQR